MRPTVQGVICYHQSICIGAVSLLKEDNGYVLPVGPMVENADLIFTQALYCIFNCNILGKNGYLPFGM